MGSRVASGRVWSGAMGAVGAVVLAGCVLSFAWTDAADASVDRVVALLTTAVTLITLVLTLAYQPSAVWPPARWVIAPSLRWGLAGTAVLAIVSLLEPIGRRERFAAHVDLAVGFAAATFALGIYTSARLLIESGGAARRSASAALLARGWSAAERGRGPQRPLRPAADRPVDEAFEQALGQAIAADDVAAVIDRVAELRDAAVIVRLDRPVQPRVLRHAMRTDLRVTSLVLRWLSTRPCVDPESTRIVFEELVESTRALCSRFALALQAGESQRDVAIYLGRLARMYGWTEHATLSQFDAGQYGVTDTAVSAVISGCQSARGELVTFVDPDPPAMALHATRPWRHGLSSPEAMSLFLWGLAEPSGSEVGRALYAYHEVLTGQKFKQSFSASDVCMLTEIHRLVSGGFGPADSRRHLDEVGGATRVGADLLVAMVGTWKTRGGAVPRDLRGDLSLTLPPYRRAKEVRWFTLLDPIRLADAQAGLEEFVSLVCTTSLPGPTSFAAWAKSHYDSHIRRYGAAPAEPRGLLPADRYVAAAVAVTLRLMPLSGGAPDQAERFLRLLPDPVRSEVRDYCADCGLVAPVAPEEADTRSDVDAILEALRFVEETEI